MQPRILFVDDEPHVLKGLKRLLRHDFSVHTACGGPAGLAHLDTGDDFAVVCADFRMPEMDGAALLAEVRVRSPDSSRIMLSGQADLHAVTRVVNQAGIHRLLLKPCLRDELVIALRDAVEIHRLRIAERELLERTLAGSVKVMGEALAMASPEAFGMVEQICDLVLRMAEVADEPRSWTLRSALRLFGIGYLAVRPDVLRSWWAGERVAEHDAQVLRDVPVLSASLVRHIPRMDQVSRWITASKAPGPSAPWASQAIAAAQHYVRCRSAHSLDEALAEVANAWTADPKVVMHLREAAHLHHGRFRVEVRSCQLRPGMVLAEQLMTTSGLLLLPAGATMSTEALDRVRRFEERFGIVEPVGVLVTQDVRAQRAPARRERKH